MDGSQEIVAELVKSYGDWFDNKARLQDGLLNCTTLKSIAARQVNVARNV
jgi:hypothetical protein